MLIQTHQVVQSLRQIRRRADGARHRFGTRHQMVQQMLYFSAPRKGTYIKIGRRSGAVANVEHHKLGTATDVSLLLVLVPTGTSVRVQHEHEETRGFAIRQLGSLVFASESLVFGFFGRRPRRQNVVGIGIVGIEGNIRQIAVGNITEVRNSAVGIARIRESIAVATGRQ